VAVIWNNGQPDSVVERWRGAATGETGTTLAASGGDSGRKTDDGPGPGAKVGIMVGNSAWSDLRYAARTIRRSPIFAVAVAGTLALGIGATTSMFSVFSAV
jgi:hypothetical protein